jgi:hypothetical protein
MGRDNYLAPLVISGRTKTNALKMASSVDSFVVKTPSKLNISRNANVIP